MNTVPICLKISAFLYVLLGGALAFVGMPVLFVPSLGIAISVVAVAEYINRGSSKVSYAQAGIPAVVKKFLGGGR